MRETPNTTALLIEYGFIDNANDRRKLEENLTDYAEAVVRAVANYTGTTYIPPGGTAQNTYTVRAVSVCYILGLALFILHKDQLSVDAFTSSAIFHRLSVIRISTFLCINSENKSET